MIVFLKDYVGFEPLATLEDDIAEAIQDADMPGEFEGTVTASIVYSED